MPHMSVKLFLVFRHRNERPVNVLLQLGSLSKIPELLGWVGSGILAFSYIVDCCQTRLTDSTNPSCQTPGMDMSKMTTAEVEALLAC
jgi:hypothetical protein